jgi:hypothetical protein
MAATLVGLCIVTACDRGGGVFLSSTSPAGTYRVELAGLPRTPAVPFVNRVRLSVAKGDTHLVRFREIPTATGSIPRFMSNTVDTRGCRTT